MATYLNGKILSITADRRGTVIKLDNDPTLGPKDNYWYLMQDHGNYNALFSLAIAASANRWNVRIRIEGDDEINSLVEANVKSIRVNW